MLFNSLGFIVFLSVVLALYYLTPMSWKQKKIMLLLASYLFYGLWNPPLILLLWISTVVDWSAGKALSKEGDSSKRKWWLILSLVVNLGFLVVFKYGSFLMENFQFLLGLLGQSYEPPAWDIILPMGISFYTFQTMSYTIDLYNRRINLPERYWTFHSMLPFFLSW